MTNFISAELFDHLVDLAALQLDAQESEYLRAQLNNQLNAIQELAAIPLEDDVPPSSHGVAYTAAISPAPRQDVWMPYANTEDILSQAPQTGDRYIIVPEIPHTDLQ